MERFNDIVKENIKYTDNGNEERFSSTGHKLVTDDRAEAIAGRIMETLKADVGNFPFYCKVAYYLPVNKIEAVLRASLNGRSPQKLFSYLAKRELVKRSAGE